MIEPYSTRKLRPASYQLTLGREAHVGGEHKRVDQSGRIVLPPHQVAVVSTCETLRIPRDIIARWSLRVTNIYEGLLWTGGPQVDPGWEGPLFCPIYNLADRTVVLEYGEPLFTIDFVRTASKPDNLKKLKDDPKNYPEVWFTPQRRTLSEHDRYRLRSGPYEALQDIGWLREFRNFALALFAVMFTAIAAIVTALTIIVVNPIAPDNGQLLGRWALTALVAAGVALSLSAFSIGFQLWPMLRRLFRGY